MFSKWIRYSITGLVCVICGLVLVIAGGAGYTSVCFIKQDADIADALFWGLLLIGIMFVFIGASMIVAGRMSHEVTAANSAAADTTRSSATAAAAYNSRRTQLQNLHCSTQQRQGYVLRPELMVSMPHGQMTGLTNHVLPPTYAQATLHPIYIVSTPSSSFEGFAQPASELPVLPPPPYETVPKPENSRQRRQSEV